MKNPLRRRSAEPASPPEPTIGRVVLYRSKRNPYDLPAVITATRETLWRPGVEAGLVPDLSSPTHVHLVVLTPGDLGMYREHDIPLDDPQRRLSSEGSGSFSPDPGTWRWPEIR